MTRDPDPLPIKLYRSWTIWPPKTETQLWTAYKAGRIRTSRTEEDVKRQVDEYEDGEAASS